MAARRSTGLGMPVAAMVTALLFAGLFSWKYLVVPRLLLRPPPLMTAGAAMAGPIVPDQRPAIPQVPHNLLGNGKFAEGFTAWDYWPATQDAADACRVVVTPGRAGQVSALRIANPSGALVGMQQRIAVTSGAVYRLGATVRSTATINPNILFGGRLAFYLPPQKERQIVWMSECTNWWSRTTTFTNHVTGIATIYVHMGYGRVSSTGEFTDVRLEALAGHTDTK